MNTSTITIDRKIIRQLQRRKHHPRESYTEVLARLLSTHPPSDNTVDWRETAEILADPTLMESLAQSVRDLKEGRLYDANEV